MRTESKRLFKATAAALLIGVLGGFAPVYLRLLDERRVHEAERARLEAQVEDLGDRLARSEAHSGVARLLAAVQAGRFDEARSISTGVFDQIQRALAVVEDAEAQRRLRTAVTARDDVTAALAVGDAEVQERLARILSLLAASL